MTRSLSIVALLGVVSGCAYYNAMWSAEQIAKEARRLEAQQREPDARAQWARVALKAESVTARHPRSRWADDALVLRAEALAAMDNCTAAAAPIAAALDTLREPALRERAGLAGAHCALAGGKPADAERVLIEPLASRADARRSRAEYLAGRAAAARRDYQVAVERFRRSAEPAALPARVRALIALGRMDEAAALLDTVAARRFPEADWTSLIQDLAVAAGPEAASTALRRMLERGRQPFAARARLLIADGDRLLGAGAPAQAAARYREAAAAAPGGVEAGVARVREQRAVAARAASPDALAPVMAELQRLSAARGAGAGGGGGAAMTEGKGLLDLITRVATPPDGPGAAFRAAELARDSLGAARLAGRLFLDFAASDPASLFAPKALVAALPLLPDLRDSIVGALDAAYAPSPYTRALRGESSPGYAAAEDSLARALGVSVAGRPPASGARVAAPGWGPRGPWLDEPAPRRPPPAAPAAARPARS